MLWAVAISAGSGVSLGLSRQVPAVIAASLAIVIVCTLAAVLENWSFFQTAIYSLALLVSLQIGYLLGLTLSCARSPM
jgi:hypothetical protein